VPLYASLRRWSGNPAEIGANYCGKRNEKYVRSSVSIENIEHFFVRQLQPIFPVFNEVAAFIYPSGNISNLEVCDSL
jgi:hypothetical protein